jgi:PHD/YefM family antitoxin component YafN of YafNO toxin-antitoxin module
MIKPEDVCSLTDFQRNTRLHIDRLKQTGRPEVLTVNGQAELVVQHAAAYQRLVEELERSREAARGR